LKKRAFQAWALKVIILFILKSSYKPQFGGKALKLLSCLNGISRPPTQSKGFVDLSIERPIKSYGFALAPLSLEQ